MSLVRTVPVQTASTLPPRTLFHSCLTSTAGDFSCRSWAHVLRPSTSQACPRRETRPGDDGRRQLPRCVRLPAAVPGGRLLVAFSSLFSPTINTAHLCRSEQQTASGGRARRSSLCLPA